MRKQISVNEIIVKDNSKVLVPFNRVKMSHRRNDEVIELTDVYSGRYADLLPNVSEQHLNKLADMQSVMKERVAYARKCRRIIYHKQREVQQ